MRITEIADAVEQLELWKLINTSVWTAIDTQAKQQAEQRAVAQQQRKAKPPRRKSSSNSRAVSIAHMSTPKPPPTQNKSQKTASTKLNAQPINQSTQKSVAPNTVQATPTRTLKRKTADIGVATATPATTPTTNTLNTVNPSANIATHTQVPQPTPLQQRTYVLPQQMRITNQNKRL